MLIELLPTHVNALKVIIWIQMVSAKLVMLTVFPAVVLYPLNVHRAEIMPSFLISDVNVAQDIIWTTLVFANLAITHAKPVHNLPVITVSAAKPMLNFNQITVADVRPDTL